MFHLFICPFEAVFSTVANAEATLKMGFAHVAYKDCWHSFVSRAV